MGEGECYYTESECICESPDTDDLACNPIGVSDSEVLPFEVSRENCQTLMITTPQPNEAVNWPRYTIAQERDDETFLALYSPGRPASERVRELTQSDLDTYHDAVGLNPSARDSSTWGPVERLDLNLCYLTVESDDRRALHFDSTRSDLRWSFNVYNLSSSQPAWRAFIARTLMILPIEFMRAMPIRSVYLDMRVGLAPGRSGVGSGGANWARCQNTFVPAEHMNGVCVTYAALNRAWCTSDNASGLDLTDAQIDESFADLNKVAYTLYHEYGHVYQWCRRLRSDFPEGEEGQAQYDLERRYWAQFGANHRNDPQRSDADSGDTALWDRYRLEIRYSAAALSQGPGEGFAEAFRKRLQGQGLGSGPAATRAEQVLDLAGVPTVASVRTARAALHEYLRAHPIA